MTIEIRQMVIRAVVERGRDRDTEEGFDESRPRGAAYEPAPPDVQPAPSVSPSALVSACVREVLRELDRARNR